MEEYYVPASVHEYKDRVMEMEIIYSENPGRVTAKSLTYGQTGYRKPGRSWNQALGSVPNYCTGDTVHQGPSEA